MAVSYRLATNTRNTIGDAHSALFNGGSTQWRTGAQPTNVDDAAGGTLLGTTTFANPAFGATSATVTGRADSNTITSDTSADNSGTVQHARNLTSGAAIISDMTAAGSSAAVNFDNPVFVAGGTIAITYIRVTVPIGT